MAISDREQNFVSAVVYVHNTGRWLPPFLEVLLGQLRRHFENYELIFVDDASLDNSVEVIKATLQREEIRATSLIHLSYYHGVEAAMLAGVDLAIGDFVFEFDTPYVDYAPDAIQQVYALSLQGYDLVSALPDRPLSWMSRIFYKLLRQYSKSRIQLRTERFRIISRRGINRISVLNATIPYRKAIYWNSGLKAATCTYGVAAPGAGAAAETPPVYPERWSLAVDSLLLFTDIGTRVALYMTLFMSLLAGAGAVYAVLIYLFKRQVVEGWTTTMLFMSVSFSGLFLLMGIVIKYASMILYMQHMKQTYVVESIEKL